MRQPPVSLANISEEEKERYKVFARKKMVQGITIFLVPFVLFGTLTGLVNVYPDQFGLYDKPDLREYINLGLVLLTIIPARLYVNVILRNKRAANAWQKKIIRGKVMANDGKMVVVANQKIKMNAEEIKKCGLNEFVVITISTTGDYIFDIEKGSEEQ